MKFLIFMDEFGMWRLPLGLVCFSGLLIWAPRMASSWRKIVVQSVGATLLTVFLFIFLIGSLLGANEPQEHIRVFSRSGSRAALVSRSELRDSSSARVTVKGLGCCREYLAYEYYGHGYDYVDAQSVQWVDDKHLVIRYVVDSTGGQVCKSEAGDVHVSCEARPVPVLNKPTAQ